MCLVLLHVPTKRDGADEEDAKDGTNYDGCDPPGSILPRVVWNARNVWFVGAGNLCNMKQGNRRIIIRSVSNDTRYKLM